MCPIHANWTLLGGLGLIYGAVRRRPGPLMAHTGQVEILLRSRDHSVQRNCCAGLSEPAGRGMVEKERGREERGRRGGSKRGGERN